MAPGPSQSREAGRSGTHNEGLGSSLLPQRLPGVGGQDIAKTEHWGQEAKSQPEQPTPGTQWHVGTPKMPALRLTCPPCLSPGAKERENSGVRTMGFLSHCSTDTPAPHTPEAHTPEAHTPAPHTPVPHIPEVHTPGSAGTEPPCGLRCISQSLGESPSPARLGT